MTDGPFAGTKDLIADWMLIDVESAERRGARWAGDGSLVPLAEQDRSQWDSSLIAEGVTVLHSALARDKLGEYRAQAAIAALHCDAASAEETDWLHERAGGAGPPVPLVRCRRTPLGARR